jgi:hypothetical protein
MFSSILFRNIACPAGAEKCKLANCLFSHEQTISVPKAHGAVKESSIASVGRENGDLKRRRLNDNTIERTPAASDNDEEPAATSAVKPDSFVPASSNPTSSSSEPAPKPKAASITRPISPPPTGTGRKIDTTFSKPITNGSASSASKKQPAKIEQLTPRVVKTGGGPFQQRLTFLKLLHAELVRLNNAVKKSEDFDIKKVALFENEVVTMALDRELEANAKGGGLYKGLMTQKLQHYKKMNLDAWVKERREALEKERLAANGSNFQTSKAKPFKIETGLTPAEEVQILERFVLSPQQMSQAGFILSPPTDAQIADAEKTQEASGGYETCDRCGTRFQVLPEAGAKDGASITTNGRCIYHWGRPVFPKREKTDHITGAKEALYACCQQPKGSPGCSTQNSHVYKVGANSPGRLASILQFTTTPLNRAAEKDMAVVFDCEMGYTTKGFEMIRISACKWPSGEAMVDVLVKPLGTILDLNTKFSGVTMKQFTEAVLYKVPSPDDTTATKDTSQPLPGSNGTMKIVSSPSAARTLLTNYISPATVLIGHALDNDLNVLRLCHPTIVDTSLLFPHHGGLPYRFPLRKLAKDFLHIDIQMSNSLSEGHDSMEDSRATGDLVRVKVQRWWEKLKRQGWSVKEGKWYATVGLEQREATLPEFGESQGTTRKRREEPFTLTGGELVKEG